MQNLEFRYLYRDGGNYKQWGRVVLSNPEGLSAQSVGHALRAAFLWGNLFIATQARVPEVFPFTRGHATSDDHCFHEFDQVEETAEPPDDPHRRSASEFVAEVARESARGWAAFDPHA